MNTEMSILLDSKTENAFTGSSVKALGNGKVGGYLVRYTGVDEPDLQGDFFTSDSDLGIHNEIPVLYHHGTDKAIGRRILGLAKVTRDPVGLWVESQLSMRDDYEKQIYKLAEDGKLGWSSGALSHLVERETKTSTSAWVKSWWVAEASLTPTPAEPRNYARSVKTSNDTHEQVIRDNKSLNMDNEAKISANQPRMPKGSSSGGQFGSSRGGAGAGTGASGGASEGASGGASGSYNQADHAAVLSAGKTISAGKTQSNGDVTHDFSKKGGYADAKMKKISNALRDNGFTEDAKVGGGASQYSGGGIVRAGKTYSHPAGHTASMDSAYGATSDRNSFSASMTIKPFAAGKSFNIPVNSGKSFNIPDRDFDLTGRDDEDNIEYDTLVIGEDEIKPKDTLSELSVIDHSSETQNNNQRGTKEMEASESIAELKAAIAAITAKMDEPKVEAGKMAPVVKSLGGDHDGGNAFKHWIRTGQMNYYTKNNEQDWSATKTNALNETTTTEGGILVPEGLHAMIIAKRDEMSIIRANGAMVIQTNLDTVQVPVENARMTTAIVAESGSYVAAEPTFTSNVVPIYKFGNQLRLTDELVADEQTNIMGYLSAGLGRAFGLMENAYCIAGTGSSQPKGLITGGTAAVTAASTTAITAAELVSLYHKMPEPYTSNPNEVIFVTQNATLGALRALASSSVFTFNLQPQGDQGAQQLYGHKVAVSGYMPAATTGLKSILVTNLAAGYILIERAGMVMSRNPYLLQATGQVALFSTMRFGGTTTVAEATQILTQA